MEHDLKLFRKKMFIYCMDLQRRRDTYDKKEMR